MPVPFVSEASITALEAAIARYQQIAASGGWPMVGDNATLRPGDTSADIATIRKHLMIEGDLPQGKCQQSKFRRRVPGRTRALSDPQRPARQRLRQFPHARGA